jgi:hypothetical protein
LLFLLKKHTTGVDVCVENAPHPVFPVQQLVLVFSAFHTFYVLYIKRNRKTKQATKQELRVERE